MPNLGEWIIGRGWHQENGLNHCLPPCTAILCMMHYLLSQQSVILEHASGHGVFANKMAMDMA
ncbi:MAG: hypothetical protein IPP42_01810 [Saprospiraceae bacterium]|nr:hypothetical protein [Saprospiraceae bacterium]